MYSKITYKTKKKYTDDNRVVKNKFKNESWSSQTEKEITLYS